MFVGPTPQVMEMTRIHAYFDTDCVSATKHEIAPHPQYGGGSRKSEVLEVANNNRKSDSARRGQKPRKKRQ